MKSNTGRNEARRSLPAATGRSDRPPGRDPRQNHLLASLPAKVWQRWAPLMEPAEMPLGTVIYEPNVAMDQPRTLPTHNIAAKSISSMMGNATSPALVMCRGFC